MSKANKRKRKNRREHEVDFDANLTLVSIYFDVMQLRDKLHSIAKECGRSIGLRSLELGVLNTLRRFGPMTMGELGRLSVVSQTNTTRVVRDLADKKLVKRRRSEESDRHVVVELTSAGEQALRRAYPQMVESIDELFRSGITMAERKKLAELLHKVTPEIKRPD